MSTTGASAPRRWLSVRPRGLAHAAVWLIGAGAALATIVALLAPIHWLADLATHFRVQYAVALSAAALVASIGRRWRRAAAASVLALYNAGLIAAAVWPIDAAPDPRAPSLRVLVANVQTANRRHTRVARLIEDARPDIVALIEVNRRWLRTLEPVLGDYPHRIERPQDDNFGLALYSRHPLAGRIEPFDADLPPSILAELTHGNTDYRIVVTHPPPPLTPDLADARDRQIRAVANHLERHPRALVLADLNATPWSNALGPFERIGLRNARRGHAVGATWPSGRPWLAIPIDHVLMGSGLVSVDFRVGPRIGSDHKPIVVELAPRLAAD